MGRCHIQQSSRSSQRHQCFFDLGNGSRPRPWQSSPVCPPIPGIRSNSAVGRCCISPTTSYPASSSSRRSEGRSYKVFQFRVHAGDQRQLDTRNCLIIHAGHVLAGPWRAPRRKAPKIGSLRRPGVLVSQRPEPQKDQCRFERQRHNNYEHYACH